MASIADIPYRAPPSAPESRRREIRRWRRRSRVVGALRIILPGLIGLILAGLAGSVVYSSLTAPPVTAATNEPIRLINPRFVGRDVRSRAFVLTALTATRDPNEYQKVYLDKPALVLDEEGADPLRITAASGVYHEDTRKLEVSGGVRLSGASAAFETLSSQYDVSTGELVGSGPIHGSSALGDISAKSYGVYDKGDRMVFKGGVHTVLQKK